MPFAWSPAVLEDLHRFYVQDRLSAAETARALGAGVTRNAVLGKVQRLGWTRDGAPKAGRRPAASPTKTPRQRPIPTARPRPAAPFARVLPLPKLREIATVGAPRLWTERQAGECAFPVGEPEDPGRQYSCCAPVQRMRAYCPAHWALMTVADTALTPKDQDAILQIARRTA